MIGERRPRKRPAFEPVARSAARSSADPSMRRPAATVAGSILVLLRAAAGALWGLSIAWGFPAWIGEAAALFGGDSGDSVPSWDNGDSAFSSIASAVMVNCVGSAEFARFASRLLSIVSSLRFALALAAWARTAFGARPGRITVSPVK